jgi:hypothetical protein
MPGAPAVAAAPRAGDTRHSGSVPAAAKADEKPPRPRTDTVALVEQNASRPREVPTWLAVIAIILLSLVAGMATYLIRMRTARSLDPGTTTTASAAYEKAAKGRAPGP